MDTSNVDTVFIGGKLMKSGGQLVGVDGARVTKLAQDSREDPL